MKTARIIIGANYGDEGKGTVTAHYTKNAEGSVLNILTNGGTNRAHSILTEDGSMTFRHFGSGTYYGADNYYSRFFILNPMQFAKEYEELIVKPTHIYRDINCRWSTPYDVLSNVMTENRLYRKATCGMGIWTTVRRWSVSGMPMPFDAFIHGTSDEQHEYLNSVKRHYEYVHYIHNDFKDMWESETIQDQFIQDCKFMYDHTISISDIIKIPEEAYDTLIFENGQGLLLSDPGHDMMEYTPTDTNIKYASILLTDLKEEAGWEIESTAHYVTRPYLTRHGDGHIYDVENRKTISSNIQEDRTNHYNDFQGEFRYGKLSIPSLRNRIMGDFSKTLIVDKFELDVTHCDEMDIEKALKQRFKVVNTYDSPLIT